MASLTGKVASWDDDRGFGFIEPAGGGSRVFLHARDFSRRHRRPQAGLAVRFELSTDSRGRARAVRVTPRRGHRKNRRAGLALLLFAGFYGALIGLAVLQKIPLLLPGYYGILGLVTLALYARDKSAACHGRWRTPENTLHLLSLAGGWAGALVARSLFRHKIAKVSFRMVFWLTVILNLAALGWLLSPSGTVVLGQLWEVSRQVEQHSGWH